MSSRHAGQLHPSCGPGAALSYWPGQSHSIFCEKAVGYKGQPIQRERQLHEGTGPSKHLGSWLPCHLTNPYPSRAPLIEGAHKGSRDSSALPWLIQSSRQPESGVNFPEEETAQKRACSRIQHSCLSLMFYSPKMLPLNDTFGGLSLPSTPLEF